MRFLLRWQHLAPGTQLARRRRARDRHRPAPGLGGGRGRVGTRAARAPPARRTTPAALDRLCHDGEVGWLRLNPRSVRCSTRPRARRTRRRRSRSCSATTSAWLLEATRGGDRPVRSHWWARPPRSSRRSGQRGACFAAELCAATNRLARRHRARPLERRRPAGCSAPTASAPFAGAVDKDAVHAARRRRDLSRLMRGAARARASAGRWSLVPAHEHRYRPRRAGRSGRRAAPAPVGRRVPRSRRSRDDPFPVARRAARAAPARRPRAGARRPVRDGLQRRAVRAPGSSRATRARAQARRAPASGSP